MVQNKKGDAYTLFFHSPGLILNHLSGQTQFGYKDLTPIARLISDYNLFSVKNDSKLKNIKEVMDTLGASNR